VVDESGSIGSTNFNLTKQFLSQAVGGLDVDSGNTRVGLVTYSSGVGTTINLNDHSFVASLQSAISALSYAAGGTNTAQALVHVRTRMLTSAAGDRSKATNVIVVLTDGMSNVNAANTPASIKLTFRSYRCLYNCCRHRRHYYLLLAACTLPLAGSVHQRMPD